MRSSRTKAALRRWKKRIALYRATRPEGDEKAWERIAEWYPDWTRYNDYVEMVLPRLLGAIEPTSRILEIGPGSGAFTVPLARVAREVVAVEPSAGMRTVLMCNLAEAGITNVHIIPQKIEEAVEGLWGPFDLTLASYALYNVEAVDQVISRLLRLSEHVVALMGTGEPREWYRDLAWRLRGQEVVSPPQLNYFYPLLLEMGIYADVDVFWTTCNYVYDSEGALMEWWRRHFHLSESDRPALREALLPLVEWKDGRIGIYRRSRAALVWIERRRHA
jgi:SAM-dependent methyltransferase